MNDWQSWAALGVVAITAVIFLFRATSRKKQGGCEGSCGCGHKVK